MVNQAEILLSTVQHLRRYLSQHPRARGDLTTIQQRWLPGELFPPEPAVLTQALNVLINAGELHVTQDNNPVYSVRKSVDYAAAY